MSYASVSPSINNSFSNGVTAVDCEKQVRSWRLLRCLIQLLIPTCNCTKQNHEDEAYDSFHSTARISHVSTKPAFSDVTTSSVVTGTILRYGRGKLKFCLQKNPSSTDPILLIEMAVPANVLADEMRGGVLRIALESVATSGQDSSLLNSTMWAMYCNGRRVGYAVRKRPTEDDVATLRMMKSTVVGTGKVCRELEGSSEEEEGVMYLRANFKRVVTGSLNSESFHLIDPEECVGKELSIFFFRLRL